MALMDGVDLNSNEAEGSEFTIIWPGHQRLSAIAPEHTPKRGKRGSSKQTEQADDELLNDTTVKLPLHSKKTERLYRRHLKKESRKVKSEIKTFLDFPTELLVEVLGHLLPRDIFSLLRVSQSSRCFILENEAAIASSITQRRYWVLNQCFPLPISLSDVDPRAHRALLSDRWQERMKIHKNPYQHIQHIDPRGICSCMSCVLNWNNLNIILDLAHWQKNLENRQPLPVIPRGRMPEWNDTLLDKHASIVKKAMKSPLAHARILQTHLNTITHTIVRNSNWRKKDEPKNIVKPRLYRLTDHEVTDGTDEFLSRSGPPSYQPIFMRDNYYSLEAFVPNRKWDKEEHTWKYYSSWPTPHSNDLAWVVARFSDSHESRRT